jgi:hypothetical protein
MKRSSKIALVFVIISFVLLTATPVRASSAPQYSASDRTGDLYGTRTFSQCIMHHVKMLPEAKSFSPEKYQQFERLLIDFGNSVKTETALMNPHMAAVALGARIGRFFAYDAIWWTPIMFNCLPKLFDDSTASQPELILAALRYGATIS